MDLANAYRLPCTSCSDSCSVLFEATDEYAASNGACIIVFLECTYAGENDDKWSVMPILFEAIARLVPR